MPPGDVTSTVQQGPRGPTSPYEQAFGNFSLAQASQALQAMSKVGQDPRLLAQTIDSRIQEQQNLIQAGEDRLGALSQHYALWGTGPNFTDNEAHVSVARQQIANAQSTLRDLQAQKTILPEQIQQYESTQRLSNRVTARLEDFISGKDLGVSPQEQALIERQYAAQREAFQAELPQALQDTATTRGLNTTDVPVMQAVALPLGQGLANLRSSEAQAILSQANANRSLFTGINQFQQGMDLSGKQLQVGLAGQNPAANLTGVYSGLRSTSMTGSTQQTYGLGDYIGMASNAAMAAAGFMYGMNAGPGTPPLKA